MTRILIVDDKEENRYYLESLLRSHNYEVEGASHGAEALVKARREKPDIVVSDLLMPVMDGYSLLRRWKSDPELANIPFIVYTATYTEPEDEKLALSLGANAFILKPAEPDDFIGDLNKVLADVPTASARIASEHTEEDPALLKTYSQTLIRKLEEKTFQLEESNRALQRDIEERKKIEQSLRESEERFRQIAENINEVFWISAPDKHEMIYVSPAFETIWGRSCESLYKEPESWLDAIHPEDRDRVFQAAKSKQTEGIYEENYRIIHVDGSVRWIHDKAFPVRNEQEVVYRIVGIAIDMTEQKLLEEQFLRAQRMESIGTLAGGIAHDLNNMLAPIIMGTDYLRRMVDDPKVLSIIDIIGKSAHRGSDMVQQILSFTRGVSSSKVSIQVAHLLNEIETIIANSFPKNIQLNSKIPSDLWTITGDPTKLHQVILNLCVNARDAMGEAGGNLTLKATNQLIERKNVCMNNSNHEGHFVVLEVTDDGCGMSKETIEKIFDPFFTTKEIGKGTGLGLASVSGIVRSHGGIIEVESELERGSTFRVYLPAQSTGQIQSSKKEEPLTDKHAVTANSGCILVVDDEASVVSITRQTLESYGYRVLTAEDGAHGLSQFVEHQDEIDLVITDLMMPVLDGTALIAALRRMAPDIKVIAASGLNTSEHVAKITKMGISAFLPKPYSAELLLKSIQHSLNE